MITKRDTGSPATLDLLTNLQVQKRGLFKNTIKDLEIHAQFFDMLGLPRSPYAKLNIHVGAHYNDKRMALLENFWSQL